MSARAKFLFDDDFGSTGKVEAPPEPTVLLAQHAAALREAEESAFLRGVAEGRRQAESDETARLAASLQRLSLQFADASDTFRTVATEAERQAAVLAVSMARKLAGALLARQPLVEIETLARSVFAHLRATPHAVVRVHSDMVEAVKPRLAAIARETGFSGAIVVLGEADMRPGDARVEWADGGASRDADALDKTLDDIVSRYLAATRREEKQP